MSPDRPKGELEAELRSLIRDVPDFPKKGILFRDITTLLKRPLALRKAVDAMSDPFRGRRIDQVVGIEARGFILSSAIAYHLNAGFVPLRKPGKLPAKAVRMAYALEYGEDALEIHEDAIEKGNRVLIVDDLLATGGTARAARDAVQKLGGEVVAFSFLIELTFLKGREKLGNIPIHSLIRY